MLPESETLARKFFKRGGYLYLFSYLIAPAGYLINVILANDLSVSEFGILSTLLSLVMILSIYADAGLYEWLQHFFPQYLARWELSKAKALFLGVLLCRFTGGLILTIAMYLLAPWIADLYSFPGSVNIVRIYAGFFFCIAFFEISVSFLMAIQDTLTFKVLDMVRFYTTLILTALVWYLDMGSLERYALIWFSWVLLVAVLSVVILILRFRRELSHATIDWRLPWRKILGYSLIILASNNISTILHQSDMQLLAYFSGPEEAGYYGVYLKLIGIPFILLWPIIAFITPVVSELYGRWESSKIRLIRAFFRQYLIIGSLIFCGWLFATAPQLASALMSPKFALSGDIFRYSLPFVPLLFGIQIDFAILSGLGRARERIRAIVVGTVANVLLVLAALYFFPLFWLRPGSGVALAVGLSWCILIVATGRLLRDYAEPFDRVKLMLSLLMTLIMTVWLFTLMPVLDWADWTRTKQILALAGLGFLYILPFGTIFWRDIYSLKSQLTQLKNSPHVHTT